MHLLGSSQFVDFHQTSKVIYVNHRGPGSNRTGLDPLVCRIVQVRHSAAQLLACFSLTVTLQQVSAEATIKDVCSYKQ